MIFFFPLYYQYTDPPDYPLKWGNWVAIAWMAIGVVVLLWISRSRPKALERADRIFIEEVPEPVVARTLTVISSAVSSSGGTVRAGSVRPTAIVRQVVPASSLIWTI